MREPNRGLHAQNKRIPKILNRPEQMRVVQTRLRPGGEDAANPGALRPYVLYRVSDKVPPGVPDQVPPVLETDQKHRCDGEGSDQPHRVHQFVRKNKRVEPAVGHWTHQPEGNPLRPLLVRMQPLPTARAELQPRDAAAAAGAQGAATVLAGAP